jgi:F0F1-type ATP synthase delta subunit
MAQAASRRDIVRVVTRGLLDEPSKQELWVQRLAAYLVLNNKTGEADLVLNDIAHELEVQAGLVTVEVVSARQLSEAVKATLQQRLLSETGADSIAMHETLDPELVGGFIARTADAEIDASIKSKLKKLAALA